MLPLLIGLGVLIGGVILVATWDELITSLRQFTIELEKAWQKNASEMPESVRYIGEKIIRGGVKIIRILHKVSFKENGRRIEKTMKTFETEEYQVPDHILRRLEGKQSADITKPMELELEM